VDAFTVHDQLVRDYRAFTEGFVELRDRRIRAYVEGQTARGVQWPAPYLALNPAFATSDAVTDLADRGVLHRECARIFRVKRDPADAGATPIALHRHQRDAIEVAQTGQSYVLTTGTGSGKSLAYIVPIVDRVLREGSRRGVKAIVVYPMNALANSQMLELEKFLRYGYGDGEEPVTFARYTGQEKGEDRAKILNDPPDILLTNYVMLELLLTRPDERKSLIRKAEGLRFLVLDELHTYRGRQGADVAMLVRRVREACRAHDTLQCIGTSATMASGDTVAEQRAEVADVASRIFGTTMAPESVITETLVRATTARLRGRDELRAAVLARGDAEAKDPALHTGFDALRADPLASWIEDIFGITEEPSSGILVRRQPTTVHHASTLLAEATGSSSLDCATAIRATVLAGSRTLDPVTGRPLFAFRLHQFLSKGGTVYTTVEPEESRAIESEFQVVLPGEPERRLYPLAFCRECGQEYLMARREHQLASQRVLFKARHDLRPADRQDGYLFVSADREWPADPITAGRLPASWLMQTKTGQQVVPTRRDDVPRRHRAQPDGSATSAASQLDASGTLAAWIPGPLRFCLRCGVSYEAPRSGEFTKLVTLDREGRSSAMSVISSSVLRAVRALGADVPDEARKLLTFVDNRQDASLQAGHFNDFALVVQLRSALYRAVLAEGEDGLEPLDLGRAVTRTLGLDAQDYADAPDARVGRHRVDRALRGVVEYRALRDLQRGWRVTLPNLEQAGLLAVAYPDLTSLGEDEELWSGTNPVLATARPAVRVEIAAVLFDELRRVLALDAEALTLDHLDRLKRESRDHLAGLWSISETEPDPVLGIGVAGRGGPDRPRNVLPLSGLGSYGRWLRHESRFGRQLSVAEADDVIVALTSLLAEQGQLTKVIDGRVQGYRLKTSAMLLRVGTGESGAPDPLRRRFEADNRPRVVPFFRDLYLSAGPDFAGMRAAEHTAQVRSEVRQEREKDFSGGRKLPLLFCSPTMELGVDIKSLNAVAMRNVPPTPANYAQRSGRAGRSGQPAVVVTYCASGNSHDTYYFERSHLMVSGRVAPPRLDIANEDLLRSHVHAIWLAETGQGLGRSLADLLALDVDGYPVRPNLLPGLRDEGAKNRARATARIVLHPLAADLAEAPWWTSTDTWLDDALDGAFAALDGACERWRGLYSTMLAERDAAYRQAGDASASRQLRQDADSRYHEARRRMDLLLNETDEEGQSDFYTYRYLASEGFLPGYSFPRLPLAAYVPGTRGRGNNTWLQRPRFLAISEFGPGALIYHEGARYQVSRINLPRGRGEDGPGEVIRTEAMVCEACGYHHPRAVGTDTCDHCKGRTLHHLKDLMQMQTVVTRRRERISADEEERNRVGFELRTSYRFVKRGGRPGHVDADVRDVDGAAIAELTYGDAAELRVTNLGRRRRREQGLHGFWLDLNKGRWLTEKQAAEGDGDEDDDLEGKAEDVNRRAMVVPYVEDRRNVCVLRWADSISDTAALTLQYAVERGIEAEFQLEDSELSSERLPDDHHRGRTLYVEAAEGGAGVLRRLYHEPEALARAARTALEILHVDPDTGLEKDDACVRGCYRCVLSYGNQLFHDAIDRRESVPVLRRLTAAVVEQREVEGERGPDRQAVETAVKQTGGALKGRARQLLTLIAERKLRLPDEIASTIEGATDPVDFVFRLPGQATVVVVDDPAFPPRESVDGLVFYGWNVVRVKVDDDFDQVLATHPSVFREEAL